MKIYITTTQPGLNGYITINPTGLENTVVANIHNLDQQCDDAECTEILADDILDYIHGSQLVNTLKNWVSKLRHGGRLIVGGTDLIETAKNIVTGDLSLVDANRTLYGDSSMMFRNKVAQYTIKEVKDMLKECGLTIIKKRTQGIKFIVEAERQ